MSFYRNKEGKKVPIYFTASGCRTAAQGTKLYADDIVPTTRQDATRRRRMDEDQVKMQEMRDKYGGQVDKAA